MGSLQRICAHNRSIHPYGDGDPPRVAPRAGRKLLRPVVIPEGRDEAGVAAHIEETDREERQGGDIRQGQTTSSEEESQEELSRSWDPVKIVDLWTYTHLLGGHNTTCCLLGGSSTFFCPWSP